PNLNANLNGGQNPTDDQIQGDCQFRVGKAFSGMAEACNYPKQCGCVAEIITKRFSETCDDTCVANPLDPQCTNFDPKNDKVTATNAPGDDPVCLGNCPLAFGAFGRRSECLVEGNAHISLAGEQADPSVTGVVQFRGEPCPGGECPIGMEYDLEVEPVT